MKKYNNRIITISGDPASGKGSVAKQLCELYKAHGLKVKIISVGDIFRKVAVREYKKQFPEIKEPTIEQINANSNFTKTLHHLDEEIDGEIKELGKDINSQPRPGEIFIIDSRLAWFNIDNTFAVRLTVDSKTAGIRVYEDKKRGQEDRYSCLEQATKDTISRREQEIRRYKQYGADLTDPDNFKLIIGTDLASIQDIAKTIQICEERDRRGEKYAKTWASPELFYPTQSIGDTYSNSPLITEGLTLEELAKSIKSNGIYPNYPVSSITIANSVYQFVRSGHHRVFASIMAGQTLIPYMELARTDKATVTSSKELSNIYDHEGICKPDGTLFTYAEHPEIDEKSQAHDLCL